MASLGITTLETASEVKSDAANPKPADEKRVTKAEDKSVVTFAISELQGGNLLALDILRSLSKQDQVAYRDACNRIIQRVADNELPGDLPFLMVHHQEVLAIIEAPANTQQSQVDGNKNENKAETSQNLKPIVALCNESKFDEAYNRLHELCMSNSGKELTIITEYLKQVAEKSIQKGPQLDKHYLELNVFKRIFELKAQKPVGTVSPHPVASGMSTAIGNLGNRGKVSQNSAPSNAAPQSHLPRPQQ